jgi:hypothetical protein
MMLHVALFQLPDLIKSLVLRNSIHCSKFNIEDQCAVWWDGWWRTLAAVTARKKEKERRTQVTHNGLCHMDIQGIWRRTCIYSGPRQ